MAEDTEHGFHFVIKGVLHQYKYELVKDLSGCVVVEHRKGLVQKERPHYHIWIPHGSIINGAKCIKEYKQVIREHYSALNKDLDWNRNANAYYSFTPHSSFDNWPDRVPELSPLESLVIEHSDLTGPINVTYVTNTITNPVNTKSKSKAKSVLFYEHCLDILEGIDGPYSFEKIHDLHMEWSHWGYDDFGAVRNVRNAFYKLNENYKEYRSVVTNEHKNKMLSRYI